MSPSRTESKVDQYAEQLSRWRDEFQALRQVLLRTELTEEYKWRQPCYTHDGANIVIFQAFKELCALMFFKGVLLEDPDGLLREQGANTQSARRLEFRSMDDVAAVRSALPRLVAQAIRNEQEGREVEFKDTEQFDAPEELLVRFDEDPRFREAFEALTPGRQRGWLLHFSGAKKPETRIARIDRAAPRIFDGMGMHD